VRTTNDAPRTQHRLDGALLWLVIGLTAYLALAGWFQPFQFTVLAADDLRTFTAVQNAPLSEFGASVSKFRPVTGLFFSAVAASTNCDFDQIASVGLALHAFIAVLFFLLLHRSIGVSVGLSLGLTAIAVLNRFTTYVFMQEQALMEGAAVAVLLALLMVSLRFTSGPAITRAIWLTLLYLTLIHIHERYLVVALPMAVLAACSFATHRRPALFLLTGTIAAALTNLALKKLWFGMPILVGTETRPIEAHIPQICFFLWQGALTLVGINSGPAHLSLEDFPNSPFWVQLLSIATAVLSCFVLVATTVASIRTSKVDQGKPALVRLIFFLSMIAALLLSASITFRQEYRWLYPAYLVLLGLIGLGIQAMSHSAAWPRWILILLVLLSLPRELYLARRHERFVALEVYQIANNLFETLQHVGDLSSKDRIVIRGAVPAHDWIFMGDTFSRFYKLPRLEFSGSDSQVEETNLTEVVLEYSAVSRSFKLVQEEPRSAVRTHRMNFSALESKAAAFPPDTGLATPTKTPLFVISKNGVPAMVAVSPVETAVTKPETASVLHVSFSHVYSIGDGANIEIVADSPSGSKPLLSRVVPPLTNDDLPVWRKYEFPISSDTQQVRLLVVSKTDPSADWIAFRDFSFE